MAYVVLFVTDVRRCFLCVRVCSVSGMVFEAERVVRRLREGCGLRHGLHDVLWLDSAAAGAGGSDLWASRLVVLFFVAL